MNPDAAPQPESNEIQTVRWWPYGVEPPEGWREAGNKPSHHSLWSRLIEMEDERDA